MRSQQRLGHDKRLHCLKKKRQMAGGEVILEGNKNLACIQWSKCPSGLRLPMSDLISTFMKKLMNAGETGRRYSSTSSEYFSLRYRLARALVSK